MCRLGPENPDALELDHYAQAVTRIFLSGIGEGVVHLDTSAKTDAYTVKPDEESAL